jgi:hypothetical protein
MVSRKTRAPPPAGRTAGMLGGTLKGGGLKDDIRYIRNKEDDID